MDTWIRLPVCAALGISFTGCDPRRLPDPDAKGAEDGDDAVEALDPIVGVWRAIEVEQAYGSTYTVTYELTVEEDLTGMGEVSTHYDAPGTKYDEDYDYAMTMSGQALGAGRYRLDFRNVLEPERGSVLECTLTVDTLICKPDDEFAKPITFARVD